MNTVDLTGELLVLRSSSYRTGNFRRVGRSGCQIAKILSCDGKCYVLKTNPVQKSFRQ